MRRPSHRSDLPALPAARGLARRQGRSGLPAQALCESSKQEGASRGAGEMEKERRRRVLISFGLTMVSAVATTLAIEAAYRGYLRLGTAAIMLLALCAEIEFLRSP
jgi:hypothetical protein